ncbi:MAG: glyceraldehyde-3-phosphate dehydrogenase [Acidobacteria bacterium]|nr:glyceraldehyde-3-phosphate dehydrogenase [Acidobacteriota bacterium]
MNRLGINGTGRIGKLTLWYMLTQEHFDGYVLNTGREVGKSLDDQLHSLLNDSTYGPIQRFLYGLHGNVPVRIVDRENAVVEIGGKPIKILRQARNPKDIAWNREGVRLVIDTTGTFSDPTRPADAAGGSLRGHLEAGAMKVINSAPFKIKDKAAKMPDDSTMLIFGINHSDFDPARHHVISAASCTTTGLAHMIKPLLDTRETSQIMTASLSTIHAATNTQSVLDTVPKAGASDLRKNRSVFNNIILSTTGAAKALEQVLPQIVHVGFMADAVRIPTNTVSMINLNLTFHTPLSGSGEPVINRAFINDIYRRAAAGPQKDLLVYTEAQNVSADLIGGLGAVVIEGQANHTRTGFIDLSQEVLHSLGVSGANDMMRIPVTHAKIFGWYDNEFGSYVMCLSQLAIYIDNMLG